MSEIWIINEKPNLNITYNKSLSGYMNSLTADNTYGDPIKMQSFQIASSSLKLRYKGTDSSAIGVNYQYDNGWNFNLKYTATDTTKLRTITFNTAPTGELLTWLQENAVKQGGESGGSTKTLKTLKVNGKVLSKVNDKYLKNLNDNLVACGKKSGKIWLINDNPDLSNDLSVNINGIMNSKYSISTGSVDQEQFTSFVIKQVGLNRGLFIGNYDSEDDTYYGIYCSKSTSGKATWYFHPKQGYSVSTSNSKARTVTFDIVPTGELLAWLRANATPIKEA